jgi:hypothetical protein
MRALPLAVYMQQEANSYSLNGANTANLVAHEKLKELRDKIQEVERQKNSFVSELDSQKNNLEAQVRACQKKSLTISNGTSMF